jgi:hypothetical protein
MGWSNEQSHSISTTGLLSGAVISTRIEINTNGLDTGMAKDHRHSLLNQRISKPAH